MRVPVLRDPPLRTCPARQQRFVVARTGAVLALVAIAFATSGCAGSAGASGSPDLAITPSAAPSLVSPRAAAACEGTGLDFARTYGADAHLYSGRITTESELAAQPGAPEAASDRDAESIVMCVYTDVPSAPSLPPRSDGVDVAYTVLGVKVNASGTAELYSMGPTGSEVDAWM